VNEDWRLRITLEGPEHAESLATRLQAEALADEVAHELRAGVAVSHDDNEVFLYTGTRAAAQAAERYVRADLAQRGLTAELSLMRWHDEAEEWEPADAPLATTAAALEAEHAQRVAHEDAEAATQGHPDFEARATLPTHRAARELSERLEREGVPHIRRWRHVFVGAADEDAAQQWAERLRAESPPGTEVTAEATLAFVERNMPTPFKGVAAMGGGLP
jgi:hypothetical protein